MLQIIAFLLLLWASQTLGIQFYDPSAIVDNKTELQPRHNGARTRLAFLKTGRCGSNVLMHELSHAACSRLEGHAYKKCTAQTFLHESLYPYHYFNRTREEINAAVESTLSPRSNCTGEDVSCGWSVCLSCLRAEEDPMQMVTSDYWKAIEDRIVENDMQVLIMTRSNPLEWAVSGEVAMIREAMMKHSAAFAAIPQRESEHYMPCSSFTLDGCSEAQREWVKKQPVHINIARLRERIQHHITVDGMFKAVRKSLLSRNEHQRILWIKMEDMTQSKTWDDVYKFTGAPGRIPKLYSQHNRYVHAISNYADIRRVAAELNYDFD